MRSQTETKKVYMYSSDCSICHEIRGINTNILHEGTLLHVMASTQTNWYISSLGIILIST